MKILNRLIKKKEEEKKEHKYIRCSSCGFRHTTDYHYCPNCGVWRQILDKKGYCICTSPHCGRIHRRDIKVRILYRNPITGKYEIIFTKCVMCGKKIIRRKKLFHYNALHTHKFYYCKNKRGHHNLCEVKGE